MNYQQLKDLFENYLIQFQLSNSNNLYEPVKYILNNGGKRMRPILSLIVAEMYETKVEKVLPVATSIEYFHNFTLLHDDIMDNADVRRGKPTVHKQFSENNAILSGDVMLVNAYQFLENYNAEKYLKLCKVFSKTAVEVCEGQQFDMDFEVRNDVTENEYLNMIKLKTAVLLGASLKMGAICANASEKDCDNLYDFGKNMGLSFQLLDDYLDCFGNEKFGKKIGGDILQNKKTFLLVKAFEKANEAQKKELQTWIDKKEFDENEKINAVLNIYKSLEIDKITQQKAKDYNDLATLGLNNLSIENSKKAYLSDYAQLLLNRIQ